MIQRKPGREDIGFEGRWSSATERVRESTKEIVMASAVTNLIAVTPRVTPVEVKQKIEQALIRSVKTDVDRISVEVQGNKVILKGRVRSWAERQEAEHAAAMAPGVDSVENRIVIAYE